MSDERSRFAEYRDKRRGAPARPLKPCGESGAWLRHQRAGESMCDACRVAYNAHAREQYAKRAARKATPAPKAKRSAK